VQKYLHLTFHVPHWGVSVVIFYPIFALHEDIVEYRNTIAGSPPGERIFIVFEKIRFASQKLNFSIFFSKKINKNALK
jgi:hypothetical protein